MPYKDPEKQRKYQKKHYQDHREKYLAYSKKYHQDHKKEKKAYRKKHYQENLEENRASVRKYAEDHREERNAYAKKYRQKNGKQIRIRNKKYYLEHLEEKRIYEKKHYQKHPEKRKEIVNKRRARKLNAPGSHTAEQIEFLRSISGGFCTGHNKPPHYIGKQKLTVDHIIPLTKGGSDFIENIQMMCGPCNSAKGVS